MVSSEANKTALSGRLWKGLAGLAVLCLAAFLAIWYMPHSQEVSWSGTAVEYRTDDTGYAAEHEAAIEGTYTYNRAGERTFEGTFWIDGLGMGAGWRARLTSEQGEDQFYDAAGQPFTAPVYEVVPSPDCQSAVVRLWDEYTVDDGGHIHALIEGPGQRFLCVGSLSRENALLLLDAWKGQ